MERDESDKIHHRLSAAAANNISLLQRRWLDMKSRMVNMHELSSDWLLEECFAAYTCHTCRLKALYGGVRHIMLIYYKANCQKFYCSHATFIFDVQVVSVSLILLEFNQSVLIFRTQTTGFPARFFFSMNFFCVNGPCPLSSSVSNFSFIWTGWPAS